VTRRHLLELCKSHSSLMFKAPCLCSSQRGNLCETTHSSCNLKFVAYLHSLVTLQS